MSNNYKKLIKELQTRLWKEQGIASSITNGGHIRFECPYGKVFVSSTSSCKSTFQLVISQLRRAGAEV